jgi:hypothetical protein
LASILVANRSSDLFCIANGPRVLTNTAKIAIAEMATTGDAAFFNRQRNNTSSNDSELSGSKKERNFFIRLLPPPFVNALAQ